MVFSIMPKLIHFPHFADDRGWLVTYDPANNPHLPFEPKRVFWIRNVPKGKERANHAHETCSQIIIPLNGGFVIEIDATDEHFGNRYYLKHNTGLLVEPGHMIRLYAFSEDAICLVLCDEAYDASEIQQSDSL